MKKDEPPQESVLVTTDFAEMRTSSLMVNVDYLDLVDRYSEREAWEILGKLKDLLG